MNAPKGSEGTRDAILPASPVPERQATESANRKLDRPAISWTGLFALFLSAKRMCNRILFPFLGKLIRRCSTVCVSTDTNVKKHPLQSVHMVIKSRLLKRKVLSEAKALDWDTSLCEKSNDLNFWRSKIRWLNAISENVSLRFRLHRTRLRCYRALLRRRNALRETRVLRAKVALLPNPPEYLSNDAVVSTEPCPYYSGDRDNGCPNNVPVVNNPLHIEGHIYSANVCGDLPLAGARMECTDGQ